MNRYLESEKKILQIKQMFLIFFSLCAEKWSLNRIIRLIFALT